MPDPWTLDRALQFGIRLHNRTPATLTLLDVGELGGSPGLSHHRAADDVAADRGPPRDRGGPVRAGRGLAGDDSRPGHRKYRPEDARWVGRRGGHSPAVQT